jgi:uncharacterized protein
MTTNGYLLNRDLFNKLLNLYIKQYQITIDGTEDIHDKNRVTIRLRYICNDIDKLK